MQNFFDLTEQEQIIIPMYGTIHMITLIFPFVMILLMAWQKKLVQKLANSEQFLHGFLILYIAIDVLYWILIWTYQVEPFYERFPLHLCASLSIVMPILILTQKYDWYRFFIYWSVCAGFISFANPNFGHNDVLSFAFIQYLVRHYYLFLFPIFMHIGKEFRYSYREFLVSISALAAYAFLIFLLDWATGANYLHLGKHNPLEIPFLPAKLTQWPFTYPAFVGVGIILLHIVFVSFYFTRKREAALFFK